MQRLGLYSWPTFLRVPCLLILPTSRTGLSKFTNVVEQTTDHAARGSTKCRRSTCESRHYSMPSPSPFVLLPTSSRCMARKKGQSKKQHHPDHITPKTLALISQLAQDEGGSVLASARVLQATQGDLGIGTIYLRDPNNPRAMDRRIPPTSSTDVSEPGPCEYATLLPGFYFQHHPPANKRGTRTTSTGNSDRPTKVWSDQISSFQYLTFM